MTASRIPSLYAVCIVAMFCAGACANREHMREDFGERTREFKTRQRVHPDAAKGSPTGLDSEEAAMIHRGYRGAMGGGTTKQGGADRVLVLEDASKTPK